ncbi:MAG: hypothetical protein IAE80_16125 [Anaerolinea sp.]|nr:hypothetical protein [Anaerolinea sp.]
MSDSQAPSADYDEPGHYEIRIKGHLDELRAETFAGLTITLEDNGETLLSGQVADQAALHGWLRKVRDLGIPLISVSRIRSTHEDSNTD